ncbi:MAG: hypothetical protein A2086_01695 [Spirochaetes bacterium GWD1_27_9]|nr:MAG: hypothetical protein A2Z98_04035 [Spirochaetes bacterium GWB1_27_13]OHD20617.1 MAG: hypothetical protein A2Y34_17515 [Spirochaetes bacterium GWC1_27_15]OHD41816.1 MAG: hypothetical protein A2086_01695 [Spirochaetes bacterium GWD1_27_9]
MQILYYSKIFMNCLKLSLFSRICNEYWESRRKEETEKNYSSFDISVRRCFDFNFIMSNINKTEFSTNNIPIKNITTTPEPEPIKNDISERAKRARRAKVRKQQEKIEILQENPSLQTELIDKKKEEFQNFIRLISLEFNKNFMEAKTPDGGIIDRIVLRTDRSNMNQQRINQLPLKGAYSVLSKGEYMFINIDYEIILKNYPLYITIWCVLNELNKNNFFNDYVSLIISRVQSFQDMKNVIEQLFANNTLKLAGFELAFDFNGKKAADLVKVSKFRAYKDKEVSNSSPSYYSKESKKHSLVIVYDRAKKINSLATLTRFEIKYYDTYMKSETFAPNLDGFLNWAPLMLAINNSKKIALSLNHASFRENNYEKMQEYIRGKDEYVLLDWILRYSFPNITW